MTEENPAEIVAVFHDRESLEKALEELQSHGLERSQLAILGTEDAVRHRLGLPVTESSAETAEVEAPVDRSDQNNVARLLAGLPAYVGAVLAAGVAVASGGTLAGAAVAALAAGAGGGLVGAGAVKIFKDQVEGAYAEQLQQGGILLLVHPRSPEDIVNAKAILARRAERSIEQKPS
jgi:hypothetical protein